jgi:hypothetical protein
VGSDSQIRFGTSRTLDAGGVVRFCGCFGWQTGGCREGAGKVLGLLTEINVYAALEEAAEDFDDVFTLHA